MRPVAHARAAVALRPRAVFSAANWVPTFVSGAKVQVFHGFNVEKRDEARGHFRVRGLFDLYCTQGPATTARFSELAAREGHFKVVETGWPKLDPVFRGEDPLAPRDLIPMHPPVAPAERKAAKEAAEAEQAGRTMDIPGQPKGPFDSDQQVEVKTTLSRGPMFSEVR